MNKNKLETISNLFENKEIRSIWDKDKEDYYYSVIDVINALAEPTNPRDYWYQLKKRLSDEEKSELSTKCRQLKMKAKDGKLRETDVLDTEGIFRLIESVPSPKAEPFKVWLAKLGRERVDEVFDPSLGIDKMVDFYLAKGYSLDWIKIRVNAIIDRKKLTKAWKDNGVEKNTDYAILTNDIYKAWSGMTASEYKEFKNIRKENLRDNMSDLEVLLTNIGETVTRELVETYHPCDMKGHELIAKTGGSVALHTRKDIEDKLGREVIDSRNKLPYKYLDKDKEKELN